MAITVEFDKLEGMSAVLTENGWEITRTAIVKGLTGTASSRLVNSISSAEVLAAGMPEIYDSHPDKSVAKLREIRPQVIDSETVKCTLVYRTSGIITTPLTDEATISVGSSVQQIDTNKDRNGDLYVSHTFTADEKTTHGITETLPEPVKQGGTISVFKPQTVREYSRRQNYSPEYDAMDYVGKINSGTWKGGASGTWLCTSITGRSNDNGDTYDVVYSFQYQAEGWNPYYVFLMPDGRPPKVTDANSLKQSDYYETANFDGLPV